MVGLVSGYILVGALKEVGGLINSEIEGGKVTCLVPTSSVETFHVEIETMVVVGVISHLSSLMTEECKMEHFIDMMSIAVD